MHRRALQDPPFCSSTEKEDPKLSIWVICFSVVSTEYPIHFFLLQTAPLNNSYLLDDRAVYRTDRQLLPCSIKQQEQSNSVEE